jgi:hypothetical protein
MLKFKILGINFKKCYSNVSFQNAEDRGTPNSSLYKLFSMGVVFDLLLWCRKINLKYLKHILQGYIWS